MVALVSSPYSIATFLSRNKAQIRPRITVIRCSSRVSSSLPSRRISRKNYLRPKILRTLSKPYPIPLPDSTPGDSGTKIEPSMVIPFEPLLEKSYSGFDKELETLVEGNEGGLGQIEVVRDSRGTGLMGLKGFTGQTVFKFVVSFVGLFVLQTVVAVWMLGSGDSDKKDRSLGIEGLYANGIGLNGSVSIDVSALPTVDEMKIAEIRRMAREVREAETRKKNLEKGEADAEDVSDDEEDHETENSLRSDIGKEVDGRLTMVRKRSPTPAQNVNFLKKVEGSGMALKNEGVAGKEGDNMLMFEAKRKFRSHLTESGDKPKGFEGVDDVREKGRNMNDAKAERTDVSSGVDKEKSVSQRSVTVQGLKKSSAENLGKGIGGSSSSRSNSSINSLSKGINKGAKPERGVVQDYSNTITLDERAKSNELSGITTQTSERKMNDLKVSTSEIHSMAKKNGRPDSVNVKSQLSRSTNKDKKSNNDQDLWWSTLPCVFAILMQKGRGSEAKQGFYTLNINSDAEYESSYTVVFEDQNDARNFSYILDSAFEDLPDAAIDVVLMSTKEVKEIVESLDKNVVVVRKGELKLYAGQPIADAESALRLLVR